MSCVSHNSEQYYCTPRLLTSTLIPTKYGASHNHTARMRSPTTWPDPLLTERIQPSVTRSDGPRTCQPEHGRLPPSSVLLAAGTIREIPCSAHFSFRPIRLRGAHTPPAPSPSPLSPPSPPPLSLHLPPEAAIPEISSSAQRRALLPRAQGTRAAPRRRLEIRAAIFLPGKLRRLRSGATSLIPNPVFVGLPAVVVGLLAKFAVAVELGEAPAECSLAGAPPAPDLGAKLCVLLELKSF